MRFADLHVGQQLELGSVTLSEQDIIEFASRFDPQPFHVDPDAALASRWKGLIASGFHTCSAAMRMVVDQVLRDSDSIGSPGLEYLKWPHPVRAGDCLFMRVHVLQAEVSKSGRVGVVRWQWLLANQSKQIVLDLVATSMFALNTASRTAAVEA